MEGEGGPRVKREGEAEVDVEVKRKRQRESDTGAERQDEPETGTEAVLSRDERKAERQDLKEARPERGRSRGSFILGSAFKGQEMCS